MNKYVIIDSKFTEALNPSHSKERARDLTPQSIITVCIELRIGRFLEAERTTQDGEPFNTGKVGVSLYPI